VAPTGGVVQRAKQAVKQQNVSVSDYTMAANVWPVWNQIYMGTTATTNMVVCNWPFSTTTTSGIITANPWPHWNQTYTAGTAGSITTTNISVWPPWMEQQALNVRGPQQVAARPSEEQVRAALEQERRWRAEAEERTKKAVEATARAERLLRTCLSEAQIADLEARNCFYVEIVGRSGKKERYRIDRGSHGNVKQVDEKGSIIRSFCVQPDGVPVPDVMLTQKLWLEASEETRAEFWETANITGLMREKDVPYHVPRKERYRYAQEHGLLH
jgi:hypothetical protein